MCVWFGVYLNLAASACVADQDLREANPLVGQVRRRVERRPWEREFFINNLLVRIHLIIEMIRRTGLAPWDFELPFQGHRQPDS